MVPTSPPVDPATPAPLTPIAAAHLPAVAAMLEDHLGTPAADMHPATHLAEDLHADELDLAAILVALECLHRIEISDAEGEACLTVGDILALLDAKGALVPPHLMPAAAA